MTNFKLENNKQRTGSFVTGLTLVATLGGLLFGYDTAVISGAVRSLQVFFIDTLNETPDQALVVIREYRITVYVVMIVIAAAITGNFTKLWGVKKGILIGMLAMILGLVALYWLFSSPPELNEETANAIKGFVVSSALVGCIIGGAMGGLISRTIGRKSGLILSAILFMISAIGSSIPEVMNIFGLSDVTAFIIYRIVGGLGVGLASMLSPMYIAEIAPANIRGKLVSWNQFAIIFGMLIIYFVNYFIAKQGSEQWLNNTGWRWMFASETIPAVVFLILLLFIPETPRFLVMKQKEEKALSLLGKLYESQEAEQTLYEIKDSLKKTDANWLSFGKLVIIIGIALAVFQQFIGINVVLYYAPEIFRSMGSATDTSLLQTIIVGFVNLLFTVLAIFTVDRFGRKPLMVIGAFGMAISMIGLGLTFYMGGSGMFALIFMLIYIASFAMSWGPVTWVLLAEIFPNKIRGAMAIAVASMWVANLIVSWTFPMMNDNTWLTDQFNHGFAYWIYGVVSILAMVFVWKVVPETSGQSLEEIEGIWRKE